MALRTSLALLLLAAAPGVVFAQDDLEQRRRSIDEEISRLEGELAGLERREGSTLDELERLSAELNLGRARLKGIETREAEIESNVAAHEQALKDLAASQAQRREYLAFRLREIYKGGSTHTLRRLLGAEDASSYADGLRYAAFLSERDRDVLADFREDERRIEEEREGLLAERAALSATRLELDAATRRLERDRRAQRRLLDAIRGDASRRESALGELRAAATELDRMISGLDAPPGAATLDMAKFRGLLEWPTDGDLRSGFGTIVHPRFKTKIPHPGWDIRAETGAPIRTVFEGTVAFAGWMRGYGLTAVVDHGHGIHSVYAHAAVLWVEPGDRVRRGERVGLVGETGSFSGPSLYFELRKDGRAVDPVDWLRPAR